MRLLPALAFLFTSLLPAVAAAQPAINARLGTQVEWSAERHPRGAVYRFGDVTLEVRPQRDGDLIAPRVTIRQGRASATMTGEATSATYDHKIGVGLFDRHGTRFVYFQSFTGGAHCCNIVKVALIRPAGIRVVELGAFDGDYRELPRDEDGDGVVDFLQVDNAFLYAFAPYAGSYAPPAIYNIVGDRAVDVSSRPSFRRLFQGAMTDARSYCRPRGDSPNGACAAYVAAAARVGQFDAAWARMLRSYDRRSDWDYPTGCRTAPRRDGGCPDASVIRYRDYPTALRAFLIRQGYIRR